MGTIHEAGDGFEYVDATHITGDIYWVNHYKRKWWYLAAALCLLAPPAGVFLGTYFLASGITTADAEQELELADAD